MLDLSHFPPLPFITSLVREAFRQKLKEHLESSLKPIYEEIVKKAVDELASDVSLKTMMERELWKDQINVVVQTEWKDKGRA